MRTSNLIIVLLLLILTTTTCSASRKYSLPEFEEEFYDDIQKQTELWEHIETKDWKKASRRLSKNPEESSSLIVRREDGNRAGVITTKSLPLHKVLEGEMIRLKESLSEKSDTKGKKKKKKKEKKEKKERVPLDFVKSLIQQHPPATKVKDQNDNLPIHLAAYANMDVEILQSLYDTYHESLATPSSSDGKDDEAGMGRLPLHCAAAFPTANPDILSFLLDKYPKAIETPDKSGNLPLHVAIVDHAPLESLQVLLKASPEAVKHIGEDGYTAMDLACKYNQTSSSSDDEISYSNDVIRLLHEAYPEGIKQVNAYGILPLHTALRFRTLKKEGIQFLIDAYPESVKQVVTFVIPHNESIAGVDKIALHFAFDDCCIDRSIVKLLMEAHSKGVEVVDGMGNLPIHLACMNKVNDTAIVQDLIGSYVHGLTVNNKDGNVPLHLALEGDDEVMEEVAALVLDEFPSASAKVDSDGDLPIHKAIRKDRSADMIHLIEEASAHSEEDGDHFIQIAARINATSTFLKELLKFNPDGAKAVDKDGLLPIHIACNNSYASSGVIKLVLDAYPEGAQKKDTEGNLPIHLASQRKYLGSESVVFHLIETYPEGLQKMNTAGLLPLHYAAKNHHRKQIVHRHILSSFPDGASVKDLDGNLPIHLACEHRDFDEFISALVDQYPEGLQVRRKRGDSRGDLPLHVANRNAVSVDSIKKLLEHYPESVSTPDKANDLPLHIALVYESSDLVILLLLEKYSEAAKVVGKRGYLPLHLALLKQYEPRIVKAIAEAYPEALKMTDGKGRIPLHVAVQVGQRKGVLDYLLKVYPDGMEELTSEGKTPFAVVDEGNYTSSYKELMINKLEKGIDYWKELAESNDESEDEWPDESEDEWLNESHEGLHDEL